MGALLRLGWYAGIVRPFVHLVLGINLRGREHLPREGPAVIVANHNSHLDAMVLASLLPLRLLGRVRPVAAADYFLRNRLLAWFSLEVVGIIPIDRKVPAGRDPLAPLSAALERGEVLILFPEGSRGRPEIMSRLKTGIAHLARRHPEVPVIPVFLHGLGKALPKGEALLVPFFCDIFVGPPLAWNGDRSRYMQQLAAAFDSLAHRIPRPAWE
ncbi:MAG TPA: 1-acyl-sn-glycerol-3-phosphate acyltransferase [Acidobacteria bacterium]|nr:1-acyl-sn-glycerol-3-phosphate acyltransferase [Acidobacteriota bacterium]